MMTDSPEEQVRRVREAVDVIRSRTNVVPRAGVITGTGLGLVAEAVDADAVVPYSDLPHFPVATAESHHGRLVFGSLEGLPVVVMQGRMHLYEGYGPGEVTFPVRVMAELGIETLLVSNAAGGMNPFFRRSDLMLVTDHINLQGVNPLEGPNVDAWGPRFPDMSQVYDAGLRALTQEIALERAIRLQHGVYAAVVGPNLETAAEYRFLRAIGSDAVGMSTVPEVIVARHMGIRCLAISVITDMCLPDALEPVTLEDVLAAAAEAEPHLTLLLRDVAARLAENVPAEV